ncbi:high frequency lysogenization protein HflD [Spongiibacter marinus]|uniref:high frequency lysogenization protein HflD n=1 Tax=Spongiibacter marinus TaxID=354246 RepID=UPI0035BE982F
MAFFPNAEQLTEQTLALASVLQAVTLVDQIARTGQAEPAALDASLASLFAFSGNDTRSVFGNINALELGIRALRDLLSGNDYGERQAVTRYCMGVLFLQNKLRRDHAAASIMRNRLEHCAKQREFGGELTSLAPALADIYQDTLSKYRFRIQVSGSAQQLQNNDNAAKIRALLLAAIRGAYLWRAAGGNRFSLMFLRNRLFTEAQRLLGTEIQH